MIFFKKPSLTIKLIAIIMFVFNQSAVANALDCKENKINPVVKKSIEKKLSLFAAKMPSDLDKTNAFVILKQYLTANPQVYGASFSFAPVIKNHTLIQTAPYVYRYQGELRAIDLMDSYDYTTFDWYTYPVELKKPVWSQPYYDEGGGNAWMVTYSVPVYVKPSNRLLGVITNDVLIK